MQQAPTPPNLQNRFLRPIFLLLFLGLSLIGLMPAVELQEEKVEAREIRTNSVLTRSSWQGASFPVENFKGYTSGFGYRRSPTDASGWEFHRGLDIAGPEGSYIRNWWAGYVVEVSDHTACGTLIKIQSGQWQHVYCHLKGSVGTANGNRYVIDRGGGIIIWQGQQLPAGARIGRIGMTGRTTGPHLHWGLKYANNYVDPAQVLRAMYSQQPGTTQQFAQGFSGPSTEQPSWGSSQGRRTID
ncbi:M23 family metallopeptidase [Funiculus sociatus GB2-A5]|uniref:M23 family metallopeptidase n=1 Tax=Funiculus sociatus GB2-A5 TaxID=2933946 RepID=A0ABV0JRS0_9CYAN|nr:MULTISPECIES: M23 family metallopeptidase [unclassified Trichocoleus]MBD1904335.1 M23 family metallopeptidase [Trichocoleus sp. FACHB-832]MBD2065014.1 M23 family metallopeptidase [Trichocoleus sp. FACHB-6]